ncbi:MAG: zinc ribbon domain-containing protein [Candidatus Bathyarchaeia archaeon]
MYCPRCGRQVPDDANICPYCGFQVRSFLQYGYPTPTPLQPHRPLSISIAAVLLGLFGFLSVVSSVFILLFVIYVSESSSPVFNPLLEALGQLVLMYALLSLVVSSLLIVSANLLWSCRKSGGYLAITAIILDLLISLATLASSNFFAIVLVELALCFAILLLIFLGWGSLS